MNQTQARETQTALESFRTHLKKNGYSEHTIRSYVYFNKRLCRFVDRPPRLINDIHIQKFVDYLVHETKIYKSYSITLVLSAIRSFHNRYLKKKIAQNIYVPIERDNLYSEFTEDMAVQLIEATKPKKYKAALAIVYSTGISAKSLVRIRLKDIQLENRSLTVRNNNDRIVNKLPLTPLAVRCIKDYLKENTQSGNYLFPGRKPSTHITIRMIEKFFQMARDELNYEWPLTLQNFRKASMHHTRHPGSKAHEMARIINTASPERRRKPE